MRYEGHGWDPKGPASIRRARAGLDQDGAVIGCVFESTGFSRVEIDTNESDPAYSLAGQLMGLPLKSLRGFGAPAEFYGFANKRLAWETVAPLAERLRGLTSGYILKIAAGTGAATGASLIGRPPSSSHSVIEHAEF
jgi:nicotinate dehydrogenase subunit B